MALGGPQGGPGSSFLSQKSERIVVHKSWLLALECRVDDWSLASVSRSSTSVIPLRHVRSLRLDPDLGEKIRRAAMARGESVSEFLRRAAADRAEETLADRPSERFADVAGVVHGVAVAPDGLATRSPRRWRRTKRGGDAHRRRP